jgi:molecular chaperone DnaK
MIDARNELDSTAYQVERRLSDLGDSVPVHEKARAEQLINDARQAVKGDAPLDRLRSLTSELQQVYQSLGAAGAKTGSTAGQDGGDQGGQGGQAQGGQRQSQDEDVIDAEFTTG